MASNDQWPPVASAGRGGPKVNKRNIKDSQQKTLSLVTEMFSPMLEPEIILIVVQNCNWELQRSIDDLIKLTESVKHPSASARKEKSENTTSVPSAAVPQRPWLTSEYKKVLNTTPTPQQQASMSQGSGAVPTPKWDKPKRSGEKNRMDSFCENIPKLKASKLANALSNSQQPAQKNAQKQASPSNDNLLFDNMLNYGHPASESQTLTENPRRAANYGNLPEAPVDPQSLAFHPVGSIPWSQLNPRASQAYHAKSFSSSMKNDFNRKMKFVDTKAAAEKKEFNRQQGGTVRTHETPKSGVRKVESESFCGLKVQYRLNGMESSSDDDADVVIEEEMSDYEINLSSSLATNVSQFLSTPTQTPPHRSRPEFHMISTPSPSRTPQKRAHDVALERIKSSINNGYRIMILLRGLPGSGKSTLARSIVVSTLGRDPAPYIFNTDDFFLTQGGLYKFDITRLQDAHSNNQKRVANALRAGRSPVIVDNTNIEVWEMRKYVEMAVNAGYIVEILEPDTPWARDPHELAKRNLHGVSKRRILERAERFERMPSGKHLIEKFSLKYSQKNHPPQFRLLPPFAAPRAPPKPPSAADIKLNWDNHDSNSYVLSRHDIESMRNIDENHGSTGDITESNSAPEPSSSKDSSESSHRATTTSKDQLFDDYLHELQDSSDDESFSAPQASCPPKKNKTELIGQSTDNKDLGAPHKTSQTAKNSPEENFPVSDLEAKSSSPQQIVFGAIGSERKSSLSVTSSSGNIETERSETDNSSPTGSQQVLGAIGSERRGTSSTGSSLSSVTSDKSDAKDSSTSPLAAPLGAIGSERKGSFSVASGVAESEILPKIEDIERKDNVLAQCWDFTLLLGEYKIHSRHSVYDLPSSGGRKSPEVNEEKDKVEGEEILDGIDKKIKEQGEIDEIETEKSEVEENLELKESSFDDSSLNGVSLVQEEKEIIVETTFEPEIQADKTNEDVIGIQRPEEANANLSELVESLFEAVIQSGDEQITMEEPVESIVEKMAEVVEQTETADGDGDERSNQDDKPLGQNDKLSDKEDKKEDYVGERADSEAGDAQRCEVQCLEIKESTVDESTPESISLVKEEKEILVEKLEEDLASEIKIEPEEETIEDRQLEEEEAAPIPDSVLNSAVQPEDYSQASELLKSLPKNIIKVEEVEGIEAPELPESSNNSGRVTNAFGSFFNLLKSSILGAAEESTPTERPQTLEEEIKVEPRVSQRSPPPSSSLPDLKAYQVKDSNLTDTVDSPNIEEQSTEADSAIAVSPRSESEVGEKVAEINTKITTTVSTNPFAEEVITSSEAVETNQELLTDNINSISWKELPFPIDDSKIPQPTPPKEDEPIQKLDAFTNTTYWDFNVLYHGGVCDPQYRVIPARNRCINEGIPVHLERKPPTKLTLDAGSMASEYDILKEQAKDEEDNDSSEKIKHLADIFSNIPVDILTAFYHEECGGDLAWAIDLLQEGVPANFILDDGLIKKNRSHSETEASQRSSASSEKKGSLETEKEKARSSSLTPKRLRAKLFRALPLAEFEDVERNSSPGKDHEEFVLESLYANIVASGTGSKAGCEETNETSASGSSMALIEKDNDRVLEFDFGWDFINQLEKAFGNTDFAFPDEIKPVIRVKKSMAGELHALWIQSMYDQLSERHLKQDATIAEDEKLARALESEENAQQTKEAPQVPNLEDIMNMEMVLAYCRNKPNDKSTGEQVLCEYFPDIDPRTLRELLAAHDGNFEETCETIRFNTGSKLPQQEVPKKQLVDVVKEENKSRGGQDNSVTKSPIIVVRPDAYDTDKEAKLSYKQAIVRGQEARQEAQRQFSLRMENLRKASEAYRKGLPGVASHYSQMADKHAGNVEDAHAEAAEAFYSAQRYRTDYENTLDLHNFSQYEASLALDKFLELQSRNLEKSNKKSSTLYIITGRGARSNNGKGVIKPAVSDKLTRRNIRFSETNPGCLKITLSKR